MSVEAHFWVAPGVEVFAGQRVPSPPPPTFSVAIYAPCELLSSGTLASDVSPIHHADFRRNEWGTGGEVAHYDLESQPHRGYRWLVVQGELRAERIA